MPRPESRMIVARAARPPRIAYEPPFRATVPPTESTPDPTEIALSTSGPLTLSPSPRGPSFGPTIEGHRHAGRWKPAHAQRASVEQGVTTPAAFQEIAARSARQQIGPLVSAQGVYIRRLLPPEVEGVEIAAKDEVRTLAPPKHVVVSTSRNDIVTWGAKDAVTAGATLEDIPVTATRDHVVAVISLHGVKAQKVTLIDEVTSRRWAAGSRSRHEADRVVPGAAEDSVVYDGAAACSRLNGHRKAIIAVSQVECGVDPLSGIRRGSATSDLLRAGRTATNTSAAEGAPRSSTVYAPRLSTDTATSLTSPGAAR